MKHIQAYESMHTYVYMHTYACTQAHVNTKMHAHKDTHLRITEWSEWSKNTEKRKVTAKKFQMCDERFPDNGQTLE